MDVKILEALKASIAKLDALAQCDEPPPVRSITSESCPLCLACARSVVNGIPRYVECDKCPAETCEGSAGPSYWESAYDALHDVRSGHFPLSRFHDAARAEADFLRSLLPAEG